MINQYKYSLFVAKTRGNRKWRKKKGINKYTGIILDTSKKFFSDYVPESYNKLGSLVYMMNDMMACMVTRSNGEFSVESGDYTDSITDIARADAEFKEYCTVQGAHPEGEAIYRDMTDEDYKKIDLCITINNEGFDPFAYAQGTVVCKSNFVNTDSNVTPKIRNRRINAVIKAYQLTYKNVF